MSKVAALEAELALAKLEEKFIVAKKAGNATAKMKADLRVARQEYRDKHRGLPGGVAVQPDTVKVTAGVNGPG